MFHIKFPYTYPKISFLSVLLATDFAGEGFLAGVGDEVPLHGGHADKLLAAHSADRKNLGGPLPVTLEIINQ